MILTKIVELQKCIIYTIYLLISSSSVRIAFIIDVVKRNDQCLQIDNLYLLNDKDKYFFAANQSKFEYCNDVLTRFMMAMINKSKV